jgi:hypothetical protein
MSKQMIVWGVLCRSCSQPVAFGSPSHQQFELESAYAKPGAIRCANGHNYIYFPRDFKFFVSAEEIPEAAMLKNREAHNAVNPAMATPSGQLNGTRWVPDTEKEPGSPEAPKLLKVLPANSGPDPRREAAQAAAKSWWANWAHKKVS